jgi:hypothetical protein
VLRFVKKPSNSGFTRGNFKSPPLPSAIVGSRRFAQRERAPHEKSAPRCRQIHQLQDEVTVAAEKHGGDQAGGNGKKMSSLHYCVRCAASGGAPSRQKFFESKF